MQYDLFEENMVMTLARENRELEERLNRLRRGFFAEYEEIKKVMIQIQQRIEKQRVS